MSLVKDIPERSGASTWVFDCRSEVASGMACVPQNGSGVTRPTPQEQILPAVGEHFSVRATNKPANAVSPPRSQVEELAWLSLLVPGPRQLIRA